MNQQQQKLEAFLKLFKKDVVTTKDIEAFLLIVLKVIKDSKDEIGEISKRTIENINEAVGEMKISQNYFLSKADEELKKTLSNKEEEVKTAFSDELKPIRLLITEVETALENLKNIEIPVVEKVIERVETIKEQPIITSEIKEVAVTDRAEIIRDKLETLQGNERLDASAIKGLEDAKVDKKGNIQVIGGQSGIRLSVEGIKKGLVKNLNIKAGSNTTVTHSIVNGLDTITISSTGGGSSVEIPAGTPNSILTTFIVANTPKYIVVDGVTKFETVHYTYLAGTITITDGAPPVQFIRSIY